MQAAIETRNDGSVTIELDQEAARAVIASGVIAASGTLAQIIPPSLVLIVLADQLGRSVGDMYQGAIIPGLVLAARPVARIAADVRHEDPRLTWDVGTEIPRIAGRRGEHRAYGDLIHVRDPFGFGFLARFDRAFVHGSDREGWTGHHHLAGNDPLPAQFGPRGRHGVCRSQRRARRRPIRSAGAGRERGRSGARVDGRT